MKARWQNMSRVQRVLALIGAPIGLVGAVAITVVLAVVVLPFAIVLWGSHLVIGWPKDMK